MFKISSFGGLIYASNFIKNKVHIFIVICIKFYINFNGMDFNILHMDLCGTLCTLGQVLEDSSLRGHKHMILLISSTEHQIN